MHKKRGLDKRTRDTENNNFSEAHGDKERDGDVQLNVEGSEDYTAGTQHLSRVCIPYVYVSVSSPMNVQVNHT